MTLPRWPTSTACTSCNTSFAKLSDFGYSRHLSENKIRRQHATRRGAFAAREDHPASNPHPAGDLRVDQHDRPRRPRGGEPPRAARPRSIRVGNGAAPVRFLVGLRRRPVAHRSADRPVRPASRAGCRHHRLVHGANAVWRGNGNPRVRRRTRAARRGRGAAVSDSRLRGERLVRRTRSRSRHRLVHVRVLSRHRHCRAASSPD